MERFSICEGLKFYYCYELNTFFLELLKSWRVLW